MNFSTCWSSTPVSVVTQQPTTFTSQHSNSKQLLPNHNRKPSCACPAFQQLLPPQLHSDRFPETELWSKLKVYQQLHIPDIKPQQNSWSSSRYQLLLKKPKMCTPPSPRSPPSAAALPAPSASACRSMPKTFAASKVSPLKPQPMFSPNLISTP